MKRVIFIRPGETEWNKAERWQGNVAVPLSEHGQAQALRLAHFVRNTGITALYTSDLRRALETAALLAGVLGFPYQVDERLRERDIGIWQGLTQAEVEAWYPAEYEALRQEPDHYLIPRGESRVQVAARMKAAFDDIIAQPDRIIGVVTHTTAMRALFGVLIPGLDALKLSFSNMSVTSLMQDEQHHWHITQRNDVTHLEGMATKYFRELEQKEI